MRLHLQLHDVSNLLPAYVVPNPNCCYGNPVGVGYNGGCSYNVNYS